MKRKLFVVLVISLVLSFPAFGQHVFSWQSGSAESGYLGVSIRNLEAGDLDRSGQDTGVVVVDVADEGPAAEAGIQEGDLILEYAGLPVLGTRHLTRLVSETAPGRTVEITLSRGGERTVCPVTIKAKESPRWFGQTPDMPFHRFRFKDAPGFRSETDPEEQEGVFLLENKPRLGIQGVDLTRQMADFLEAGEESGVLVLEVLADTPAARAGLQAGDVIIELDGKKVRGMESLRQQLSGGSHDLEIIREKTSRVVSVILGQSESREERNSIKM